MIRKPEDLPKGKKSYLTRL